MENRGPEMEDRDHVHASEPRRLVAQSPPSLLIVEQDPDLREFLHVSLQRWYQVAEVSDGTEAAEHLEHCPPRGLIVGQMTSRGEEALVSVLQDVDAPPVLRLWTVCPPAGWADEALRHPFMRVDLLRAVDRLVHAERREKESDEESDGGESEVSESEVEIGAEVQGGESRNEDS